MAELRLGISFGEKKLENVNVRMSGAMVDAIDGLAAMGDMNRSAWICMVIQRALDEEWRRHVALKAIFESTAEPVNSNVVAHDNTRGGVPEKSAAGSGER